MTQATAGDRPEPAPVAAQVAKAPPAAYPPSFDLLRRTAAACWFALLAILYVRLGVVSFLVIMSGRQDLDLFARTGTLVFTAVFYTILAVLFVVRQPSRESEPGTMPALIAFLGTFGPWIIPFLPPTAPSLWLDTASALITLVGEVLIVFVIVWLGRAFSITPNARKLVTGGPYRLVRHPLYVVEEIALFGIVLPHAPWAVALFMVCHAGLQIRRMIYEERLLSRAFPEYEAYAGRTARLIPGVW